MQARQTSIAKGLLLGIAWSAAIPAGLVSTASFATTPGAKYSDFNGDGHSDILWHNWFFGQNVAWLSGSNGTTMDFAGLGGTWRPAGLGITTATAARTSSGETPSPGRT